MVDGKQKMKPIIKLQVFIYRAFIALLAGLSWANAVKHFLQAKSNEQLLKVWVNTTLGETWVVKGEAPDWQRLYERREHYKIGVAPRGGLLLTAGVNVQKDRL